MLKARFTTAPVLTHPDSLLPIIIEVDASKVGVGAVLSQCTGTPPKLQPCAFYSKQLSPAQKLNKLHGNSVMLMLAR
jgi:hypothetical protein